FRLFQKSCLFFRWSPPALSLFRLLLYDTAPPAPYALSLHDALPIYHVPSESSIDAEAVIAAAPDLVLLNDRHGLEEGVGSVLEGDRKSTRLNSSHVKISYAVFCLKKKNY